MVQCSSVFLRNRFECRHHRPPKAASKAGSNINTCILSDCFVLGCFPSLEGGTRLWPKETNIIGQIASTGSPLPLLYDLSLSTANSGSSHRTPDCINILYRTHREGFRAYIVYCTTQSPPRSLCRFQTLLNSLGSLH